MTMYLAKLCTVTQVPNPTKDPIDETQFSRSEQWQLLSVICDKVRRQEATQDDWAFLAHYANPILLREMIKEACRIAAGLKP